jgi:potassium channel
MVAATDIPTILYIEKKCEDVSKKVPTLEGDNDSTKLAQETIQQRMPHGEENLDAVQINCERKTST